MVAMSFAVKELLVALKGFVSNFILAKSTPAVMKKKPTEQLLVTTPLSPIINCTCLVFYIYFKVNQTFIPKLF